MLERLIEDATAERPDSGAGREPDADSIDVASVRDRLARHRARRIDEHGEPFAAVAMILAGGPRDPWVLFIERAKRLDDPWSGHMAFPGGRVQSEDADARKTAERETFEEVGIDLTAGELLGRLDDQAGRRAGTRWSGRPIAGYVYHLADRRSVEPSPEVEEALWVPSSALLDPGNQVDYNVSYAPGVFPGILVGKPDRHVIWGLTYRFLESFLSIIGRRLGAATDSKASANSS
jgi:8-oxo-dGTP pyrophosphatase MutT (NUDIX family)